MGQCPTCGEDRHPSTPAGSVQTREEDQGGARIFKSSREPRYRFPAWRAGTTTIFFVPARQVSKACGIESSESVPGLHNRLQIRAQEGIILLLHNVTSTWAGGGGGVSSLVSEEKSV